MVYVDRQDIIGQLFLNDELVSLVLCYLVMGLTTG